MLSLSVALTTTLPPAVHRGVLADRGVGRQRDDTDIRADADARLAAENQRAGGAQKRDACCWR